MTLKFNGVLEVVMVHVHAKFQQAVSAAVLELSTNKTQRQCRKQYCRRFRGQQNIYCVPGKVWLSGNWLRATSPAFMLRHLLPLPPGEQSDTATQRVHRWRIVDRPLETEVSCEISRRDCDWTPLSLNLALTNKQSRTNSGLCGRLCGHTSYGQCVCEEEGRPYNWRM